MKFAIPPVLRWACERESHGILKILLQLNTVQHNSLQIIWLLSMLSPAVLQDALSALHRRPWDHPDHLIQFPGQTESCRDCYWDSKLWCSNCIYPWWGTNTTKFTVLPRIYSRVFFSGKSVTYCHKSIMPFPVSLCFLHPIGVSSVCFLSHAFPISVSLIIRWEEQAKRSLLASW